MLKVSWSVLKKLCILTNYPDKMNSGIIMINKSGWLNRFSLRRDKKIFIIFGLKSLHSKSNNSQPNTNKVCLLCSRTSLFKSDQEKKSELWAGREQENLPSSRFYLESSSLRHAQYIKLIATTP